MRVHLLLASILLLAWDAHSLRANPRIYFDQNEYVVSAVDETFEVQILIDGNRETPDFDPLTAGLFSFAAEVSFDPVKAELTNPGNLMVPPELDHFGFAPGSMTHVAAGIAAAKGNIDQLANPLVPYDGERLMTLTLTNKSAPFDSYPLDLGLFQTLGASEQLFLDGTGVVLDDDLEFDTAMVRVVPEPGSVTSCLVVSLMFTVLRRQRRVRNVRR